MKPIRIKGANSDEQLLYFTTTSISSDGRYLVFLKDVKGSSNIFVRDLISAEERQLSANTEGILKSYQYFQERWKKGLGKGSVSFHPQTKDICYVQGTKIFCINVAGQLRMLAEYPNNQVTAYSHISGDGKLFCLATTDEEAFNVEGIDEDIQPNYNIDKKCRESKLNSYLRIYDISTGEEIITEIIPGAWVTHVQFCPVNNNIILYNNEWCRDGGMRRIWIWDGKNHKKLRSLRDGRDAEDWVSHEVFMPDGESVFYHGIYKNGDAFIGKINVDGANCVEIEMDEGFNAYGHFSLGNNGLLVSDGYYKEKRKGKEIETGILAQCKEIFFRRFKFFLALRYREKIRRMLKSNSKSKGAWISILKVDWQKQIIDWIPLCQHGSSWHFQDDHPHPIFNYDSSEVLFTSDRGKRRAIYRMSISK